MSEAPKYDLEERSLLFALRVDQYILKLPKNIPNIEHGRQLARSGSAIGANYIEANDSLGKKDFLMRLRIARKEAKETRYWLLLTMTTADEEDEKQYLILESTAFIKILSTMIIKSQ